MRYVLMAAAGWFMLAAGCASPYGPYYSSYDTDYDNPADFSYSGCPDCGRTHRLNAPVCCGVYSQTNPAMRTNDPVGPSSQWRQ